ncbi:hypothetical protein M3Y98_00408900 [Aphelenchoides besseyi]|nr:hypothetical protein M3Y98_00408900 [Aphelenchoides besseyi]
MGVVTFSKNWMYWTSSFVAIVLITFNKRLLWRAFWTFVAVATIAAFVIQSIFLIKEYLQFQKTTNMQINVLSPATFPAVTVCSLNPYQYSKINNSKSLADLMIAYNYIVEAREARLRNQSTTKPPQNLTDDQATFQRELIRHKRQSGISGTFANQYNNTLFTIVNSQAASTSAIVYCNANTTSLNFNYNSSTTAYMINVIDAVWYYCLGGMVCAIPSTICQDYTDSYELLQDINNCAMGLTNTIPGFQYPPNNTEANPAAGMAIGVAKYLCTTYANPKCDYGDYAKPENKYNGTYVYKHCTIKSNSTDTIKMSITQCDGSELTTSVAYPSNCTTFMNQFVKDLTDTMAQYDCGKSCKYPNPINQSTTVCGNSYYYDLLSEWAECNLTSSTEFTSTTALTTTELSTIELTTTESTTTELTTTVKQPPLRQPPTLLPIHPLFLQPLYNKQALLLDPRLA